MERVASQAKTQDPAPLEPNVKTFAHPPNVQISQVADIPPFTEIPVKKDLYCRRHLKRKRNQQSRHLI